MRINQYISSTGYCSRRQADKLLKEGLVTINGQIAALGDQVQQEDVVEVEGKRLETKSNYIYIAYNKPVGITSTTERHIKGNIIDAINHKERIFPIGRLDKDSQGLILLTNNGNIVNQILSSENNHEKDYIVVVNKDINNSFLKEMSNGVQIYNPVKNEYTVTNPSKLVKIDNRTFKITLTQGLNRQIRRMCTKLGYRVTKLQRIRIMNIHLDHLKIGNYRNLTQEEITELLDSLKLERKK